MIGPSHDLLSFSTRFFGTVYIYLMAKFCGVSKYYDLIFGFDLYEAVRHGQVIDLAVLHIMHFTRKQGRYQRNMVI